MGQPCKGQSDYQPTGWHSLSELGLVSVSVLGLYSAQSSLELADS